jgi:hypothetical protein
MRPFSSTSVNPYLLLSIPGRADPDQDVGAQPGVLPAEFPFQADGPG